MHAWPPWRSRSANGASRKRCCDASCSGDWEGSEAEWLRIYLYIYVYLCEISPQASTIMANTRSFQAMADKDAEPQQTYYVNPMDWGLYRDEGGKKRHRTDDSTWTPEASGAPWGPASLAAGSDELMIPANPQRDDKLPAIHEPGPPTISCLDTEPESPAASRKTLSMSSVEMEMDKLGLIKGTDWKWNNED